MQPTRAIAPPFASVLVIGDRRGPRVARLIDWLQDRTSVHVFDCPSAALASSPAMSTIDLVLLAPSVRGEWRAEELQALTGTWPLALVVLLVDAELEGETRSGRPWPGLLRLYWYQFEPQWELAERWKRGSPGERGRPFLAWRPATETAEERVVTGPWPDANSARSEPSRDVWIHARTLENRRTLEDVCRSAGWRTTVGPEDAGWSSGRVSVVLYDAAGDRQRRIEELRWIARAAPGVPIVMLVDFPRYDEMVSAELEGVKRVLGKPYRVEELWQSLDACSSSLGRTSSW